MSRYELIRLSGLAGLAAGLLIMAGAVSMSYMDPGISGSLFVAGHILLFFLLTGEYLTFYANTGIWGLLGYTLATIGNSLFVTFQLVYSFFISGIEGTWVLGAVDLASPLSAAAIPAVSLLFGLGLLLVAISTTRAGAPAAWAGWLMFLGLALNLLLPVLPVEVPELLFAVSPLLLGLGVVGFGLSLRRN